MSSNAFVARKPSGEGVQQQASSEAAQKTSRRLDPVDPDTDKVAPKAPVQAAKQQMDRERERELRPET